MHPILSPWMFVWCVEHFEQPPSRTIVTLSSGSDSSSEKSPTKSTCLDLEEPGRHQRQQDTFQIDSGEDSVFIETKKPTNLETENDQILSQGKIKNFLFAAKNWNIFISFSHNFNNIHSVHHKARILLFLVSITAVCWPLILLHMVKKT